MTTSRCLCFSSFSLNWKMTEWWRGRGGTKQVSEINRSCGVLTIKIREGDIMMGMMARFMCGWEGKISKWGPFPLPLRLSDCLSPSSFEHLISRPLISGNNQWVPPPCCILPERRAHVGILPHQPGLCSARWLASSGNTNTRNLLCTNTKLLHDHTHNESISWLVNWQKCNKIQCWW